MVFLVNLLLATKKACLKVLTPDELVPARPVAFFAHLIHTQTPGDSVLDVSTSCGVGHALCFNSTFNNVTQRLLRTPTVTSVSINNPLAVSCSPSADWPVISQWRLYASQNSANGVSTPTCCCSACAANLCTLTMSDSVMLVPRVNACTPATKLRH